MRIISRKTIKEFWTKHADSEQPLKAWYDLTKKAVWKTPNELKSQIVDASIISGKRVVFNIKDNDYRLVVDIEYSIKLVFLVWFGTHKEYDNINVKTIFYVKSNKNKKRARSSSKKNLRIDAGKLKARLKKNERA